MIRSITAAAFAVTALLSAGVSAAAPAGYFVATPVAASTKTSLITRDTPWRLEGASFVAAKAPLRDMIACQLVAHSVGALSSFSAGGKAFDTTELAACNAKAKVDAAAANLAN